MCSSYIIDKCYYIHCILICIWCVRSKRISLHLFSFLIPVHNRFTSMHGVAFYFFGQSGPAGPWKPFRLCCTQEISKTPFSITSTRFRLLHRALQRNIGLRAQTATESVSLKSGWKHDTGKEILSVTNCFLSRCQVAFH